ncbi:MAG: hypothetical protein JRH07_17010 [Deltaproteobacteria bacterium]|nr:hypothetical protein [Deltaproteobacteria bacterium]MBW2123522.1 hypothetical protein [Deltaproteobacteria bacterium]
MKGPTQSRYLDYLPALYREDPFLGEFLLPFERVFSAFEGVLATIDRYFAPALTDAEFLPWLATWVSLVLDEEWDEAKRRRLIGEAVELYRWRGTVRGLKRYLEIYTGLVPDIRECRWPAGLQIGVASRIGGTSPEDISIARIEKAVRRQPPAYHDYYVVERVEGGEIHQWYYRADTVREVTLEDGDVTIHRVNGQIDHYEGATITRRDGLVDEDYTLAVADKEGNGQTVHYRGDTVLVDEAELPYRFIVDVQVPQAEMEKVKLDKVRAIVDLEKPAHTIYYLKLTPVVTLYRLKPMQIGIRSTIGLDTTVG